MAEGVVEDEDSVAEGMAKDMDSVMEGVAKDVDSVMEGVVEDIDNVMKGVALNALKARESRIEKTDTHTENNYCNRRCACAPRINKASTTTKQEPDCTLNFTTPTLQYHTLKPS